MAGRLSGIFVSKVLKPRTMIAASLVGCLAASVILVIWGASSAIGVYIGTCKLEWPALWRITMNSLHNEGIYK